MDDIELLREYVQRQSEEAFALLVSRHINLVYSVALRKTGNAHAADEITQAVFIILARKAKTLRQRTILSGWLYQTARLTASNYLRAEARRVRREQEAYMQSVSNETEPELWPQIAPLLDDAMSRLSEKDRNAVVLRFFENKSLREIGATLQLSEDAAKMRVGRAVEKLKVLFAKRGVVFSAGSMAAAISLNSIQAAPQTLAAVTVGSACKAAAADSTLLLAKSTQQIVTWLHWKTYVAIIAMFVIGAGTTLVALNPRVHAFAFGESPSSPASMLIVPKTSVGGVRAGMTAEQVITELGPPDITTGTRHVLHYVRQGFSVVCDRETGQVGAVFCGDALGLSGSMTKAFKGSTAQGIGMGSSHADVVTAYGPPTDATQTEKNLESLKYVPLGLNFLLRNDKVVYIDVDF
jgi:RNA polymerase sigma factor (sigma-70 family)